MKTFEVEILAYPQLFTVQANTKEEAKEIAQNKFYEKNLGKSVYSFERVEDVTNN